MWEQYAETQTVEIENEIISAHTYLIKKVYEEKYTDYDYDELYTKGLKTLWSAIKSWHKKKGEDVRLQEFQNKFKKYAYVALIFGMNDARRQLLKKNRLLTNIEMRNVPAQDIGPTYDERQKQARATLKQLFKDTSPRIYRYCLKHFGENKKFSKMWKRAGYSSHQSMRQSISEKMQQLRSRKQFIM